MRQEQRERARIMVVDDEPQNVRYVTDVLQWAGYERIEGWTDPAEAVSRFAEFAPDLVILDLLMPQMDGFEVMEAMQRQIGADAYLPVLILTSDITSEARRRALTSGAKDFLNKPMSPTEVRLRVDNLLETRFLYLECSRQADLLQGRETGPPSDRVGAPDVELEVLERWGASIDAVLPGAEGRSKRVSWLAGRIAEAMELPEAVVEGVRRAALLHELGSRPLHAQAGNGGARDRVHVDPEAGARWLDGTTLPILETVREMLAGLDERWDGTGRAGLRGEAVPIEARIVAVARAYDDLRQGTGHELPAADPIESQAGSRFDPGVVAALVQAQPVSA